MLSYDDDIFFNLALSLKQIISDECRDDGWFCFCGGVFLERTPATLNKAGPPAGRAWDEIADALEELIFT